MADDLVKNNKEVQRGINTEKTVSQEPAFIEKVVFINRVTKVTKGGKNLNFSALVVVGDGRSRASYALGKAPEVAAAIKKAIISAKKHLVEVPVEKETIPHDIVGEYGATKVLLKPALPGTGVIACLAVRSICEVSGIHNILTKVLTKSNNPINVVKAVFDGFENIKR